MSKNRKTDAKDFNNLKELGYEFRSPQDEFSYQPDSGSLATGEVGKQEYGIDIDIDAAPNRQSFSIADDAIEDPSNMIPGESEWSQQNRHPLEDREDEVDEEGDNESDGVLWTLIHNRISQDPELRSYDILIEVERGMVTLSGRVPDEALRIMIDNFVGLLPGIVSISNQISSTQQGASRS